MLTSIRRLFGRFAKSRADARDRRDAAARRRNRCRLGFERLEERAMLASNYLVLYNAPTINTYADVGFVKNPVARADAFFAGTKDRDPSHFHAEINWGDGTGWLPGRVGVNKNPSERIPLVIKGSHTYHDAKVYQIWVRVTGDGMTKTMQSAWASVKNMASGGSQPDELGGPKALGDTRLVLYPANHYGGKELNATQGQTVSGTVGMGDGYYNGPQDATPGDYQVQINWGDSMAWERGQVVPNPAADPNVPFLLQGSHKYANNGLYQVVVQFTGPDGQTLSMQTTTIEVKSAPVLYVDFDGETIDRATLERYEKRNNGTDEWLGGLDRIDKDGNGISVSRFLAGRSDREQVIKLIIAKLQEDLAPFGVSVVRRFAGETVVEGVGATTVLVGPNSEKNLYYDSNGKPVSGDSSDIDADNDNHTDIALVWGDSSDIRLSAGTLAQKIAGLILHEAGHTWGLNHVNVPSGSREAMVPAPNTELIDVAFTDVWYKNALGAWQNSYQYLQGVFHR